MRKNRMMRLASILMIAVLMTTCTISGTFAKYVTEVKSSDNARVAAWGFGETSTISFDLFDDIYDSGKVDSVDGANVIAPGTYKVETVKLAYAGTAGTPAPEVAYTIDLDIVTSASSIGSAIKSNPNIDWYFGGVWYESWDDMLTIVEGYHEDVPANQLPVLANTGMEIGWKWDFETAGDDTQDATDTAMGNGPLETVKLTVKLVATQVD